MKNVLLLLMLAGLFAGCVNSGSVTVGSSFAPVAKDELGRKYINTESKDRICYEKFSMAWNDDSGFRLYCSENRPEAAVWRSTSPKADKHVAIGTVSRKLYRIPGGQDALLEFARTSVEQMPKTKYTMIDSKFEKITFLGQDAVRVFCEFRENGREIFTRQTTVVFKCPDEPDNFLYFVVWVQSGREKDYKNTEIDSQGEKFFQRLTLDNRQTDGDL